MHLQVRLDVLGR